MIASASAMPGGRLMRVAPPAGELIGLQDNGIASFKGIPFALPPVGELRWRAPQPMPRWDGARWAVAPGPAPMQVLPARSTLLYRLNNDDPHALVMSEDCLYLNVWSPEPSPGARLPVMVWIHGGAFKTGHGAQQLFDGHRMAERGMVVVTLNMRLGALGFLALPALAAEDPLGASGNYGLMDVVAALQWVQENIGAFGGDPAQVTVAGNSAGAATVSHLMAAPAARGLFRAAIGQSLSGIFRSPRPMLNQTEAGEQGVRATARLGESLTRLRDLPASAFLELDSPGVIVDGRLLLEDSADVFVAGRQAQVPLLAGWNSDEASQYAAPAAVTTAVNMVREAGGQAWLDTHYRLAADSGWSNARRALVSDRQFIHPVWRWASTHANTSSAPVWMYRFEHQLPLPEGLPAPSDGGADFGCFHTAELPYMWDNLAARSWHWRVMDQRIARQMADTWYRFVANGNPNGGALPVWAAYDPADPFIVMGLGEHAAPARVEREGAFALLDTLVYPLNQFQHNG